MCVCTLSPIVIILEASPASFCHRFERPPPRTQSSRYTRPVNKEVIISDTCGRRRTGTIRRVLCLHIPMMQPIGNH